jgi:hypothetical protein
VYLHPVAGWFLQPMSQVTGPVGPIWVSREPLLTFPVAADPEVLGAAVLELIPLSEQGIAQPSKDEFKALTKPLLRASGFRTFTAFASGTRSVDVEASGGRFRFAATHNGGRRSGFTPISGEPEATDDQDARMVGLALIRAMITATDDRGTHSSRGPY